VDQEMKEELREHLEQQIEENIARGVSPEEARYSAMRALGGIAQIEQQCRDARGGSVLEDFVQDLRYGIRQLCRNPGFSALVILCLTFGHRRKCRRVQLGQGIWSRPYPAVHRRAICSAGTAPRRLRASMAGILSAEAARFARNFVKDYR
jgi:hypothetical protein